MGSYDFPDFPINTFTDGWSAYIRINRTPMVRLIPKFLTANAFYIHNISSILVRILFPFRNFLTISFYYFFLLFILSRIRVQLSRIYFLRTRESARIKIALTHSTIYVLALWRISDSDPNSTLIG